MTRDATKVEPIINPLTGNEMSRSATMYVLELLQTRIKLERTAKKSGSPAKRAEAAAELAGLDPMIEQAYIGEANQGR